MGNRGGGDGPAGGGSGTVRDARKASRKNEVRKIVQNFKPIPVRIIEGLVEGARKSKANVMDYEGQAAGVTPQRLRVKPTPDRDGPNNNQTQTAKSIEQPKVKSQMDNTDVKSKLVMADQTAPTNVEMTDEEYLLKKNRRGRRRTVLTSVTGDTTKPTLSKKVLLS